MEPYKRSEKALLVVIRVAYIKDVNTRKVDDLVQATGSSGFDKSKVSCITKNQDELVQDFRQRPFEEEYPYVWLDALNLKVWQYRRVVSPAVVIAVAVTNQGQRTILGSYNAGNEEVPFRLQFLGSLAKRGLKGVQLIISDAHEELKPAVN